MNKKFLYTIIFLFLASCSLSKIDFKKEDKSIEIFKKIQPIKKEFNIDLKINTKNNFKQNPFLNNNSNNNGKINFDTNFEKVSNYKFTKIKKFDSNQPIRAWLFVLILNLIGFVGYFYLKINDINISK